MQSIMPERGECDPSSRTQSLSQYSRAPVPSQILLILSNCDRIAATVSAPFLKFTAIGFVVCGSLYHRKAYYTAWNGVARKYTFVGSYKKSDNRCAELVQEFIC
jgi:hypothetical protein